MITPLVLMFEVSMLLVLSLITEKSPNIEIIPPATVLKESIVVASSRGILTQYYDANKKIWFDINKYSGSLTKIIGGSPCDRGFCSDIPNPTQGKKVIYYTGRLQRELAFLISDSCLAFPKQGASVRYHVKKDSRVDRELLLKEYPFFKHIIKQNNEKR